MLEGFQDSCHRLFRSEQVLLLESESAVCCLERANLRAELLLVILRWTKLTVNLPSALCCALLLAAQYVYRADDFRADVLNAALMENCDVLLSSDHELLVEQSELHGSGLNRGSVIAAAGEHEPSTSGIPSNRTTGDDRDGKLDDVIAGHSSWVDEPWVYPV